MLNMKTLSISGFMPFGEYPTTIDLAGSGICRIGGRNGSGKSSIIDAMLWVLFGDILRYPKPGSKVINNHSKACVCSIELIDGTTITRRRDKSESELIINNNGDIIKETMSTNTNQGSNVLKKYNLDWDGFCNTTFCLQNSTSWMELSDAKKRTELEKFFGLDKHPYYVAEAKSMVSNAEQSCKQLESSIANLNGSLSIANNNILKSKQLADSYESMIAAENQKIANRIIAEQARLQSLPTYDIEALRAQWDTYNSGVKKLQELQNKKRIDEQTVNEYANAASRLISLVNSVKSKTGTVCRECMQHVDGSHADRISSQYDADISANNQKRDEYIAASQQKDLVIKRLSELLVANKPPVTVNEAEMTMSAARSQASLIESLKSSVVQSSSNPHLDKVSFYENEVTRIQDEIAKLKAQFETASTYLQHAKYMHSAYRDKLRRMALADLVRPINEYLGYFLDRFRMPYDTIRIDEDLTIGGEYKMISGGQKMKVNLAMMFARNRVYSDLFGRQSNIMVLDEVDSALDADNIECLVSVINDDLAPSFDSIFIVSHRESMKSMFNSSISVELVDGLSYISK